jgi:hypothetical protein
MLMQNLLLYIDYSRNVHWDQFDDYLYYTRTVPSYCQILCSVFMFGATAYLSIGKLEGSLKILLTGTHLYSYVYRATLDGEFFFSFLIDTAPEKSLIAIKRGLRSNCRMEKLSRSSGSGQTLIGHSSCRSIRTGSVGGRLCRVSRSDANCSSDSLSSLFPPIVSSKVNAIAQHLSDVQSSVVPATIHEIAVRRSHS